MATNTTTLRGLTAEDREKWEKTYQAKLQGMTESQRDNLFHAAAMFKMFGHRPDYDNIKRLPLGNKIALYNNQTYINDFYNKIGGQKEFAFRDGTLTADYLSQNLSDEAKIKLAKDPRFQSNFEIASKYNKAIRNAEEYEKETNKPGFWNWLGKAFRTDGDPMV
jgi:hypothetical protein